ncbi:MAG: hypothetical protein IKZ67_00625, partial [Paludibacteraceae bacterium]|nr:hypothetical protein [Paludibacteraceae bacterium]
MDGPVDYGFKPRFEQFPRCARLAIDYISAEVAGVCMEPRIACVGEDIVVNTEGFPHGANYVWYKYPDGTYTNGREIPSDEVTYELDQYGKRQRAYISIKEKGVFYYGVADANNPSDYVNFALGGKICGSVGPGVDGENICAVSYPHSQRYWLKDPSVLEWIKENGEDYSFKWRLEYPNGEDANSTNVSLSVVPSGDSAYVNVGQGAKLSSSYSPNVPYRLFVTSHIKDSEGNLSQTYESKDSFDVWIYDQPDVSGLNFTTKRGEDTICAATSSDTILLEGYRKVSGYTWNFTGATMTSDSVIHIDGYDKQALCNMVDGTFPVSLEVVNGKCRASIDDEFTMKATHAPSVNCDSLSQPSVYELDEGQLDTTIFLPIPYFKTSCDDDPAVHVDLHYVADDTTHSFDSTYTLHKIQLENLPATALTLFSGKGDVKITVTDGCGKSDSCSYTLLVKDLHPAVVACDSLKDYNVKVSAENGCVARPGRDLDIKEPYLQDLTFKDTLIMLKGVYSGRS